MNTEEKILDELLKNTYTLEGLRKRYQVLKKKIEGEIYSAEVSEVSKVPSVSKGEEKSGDEKERDDVIPATKYEIQNTKDGLEGFDMELLKSIKNDDFVKLNEYIENFIKSAQSLSVYLVFSPEPAQLKEIGEWMRTNLKNPRLIFDIKVDAALIGGCAIAYKGVYKDYSLRAKISANKEKLIQEFREYFKQ